MQIKIAFSKKDTAIETKIRYKLAITNYLQVTVRYRDVKRDSLTYLFINDGTPAARQLVSDNYRAEPAIPFTGQVILTADHFGSVDKVYIKTLQDIVILPGLQYRMIAGAGIKTVYSVNTSHSPFLAQPQEVSDLLLKTGQ